MSQQDPYLEKRRRENGEEMANRDIDEKDTDENLKDTVPDAQRNPKPDAKN